VFATIRAEGHGFGIVFRYVDSENYWLWTHQTDRNNVLYRFEHGSVALAQPWLAGDVEDLSVLTQGNHIRAYANGYPVIEIDDETLADARRYGIALADGGTAAISQVRFLRVRNGKPALDLTQSVRDTFQRPDRPDLGRTETGGGTWETVAGDLAIRNGQLSGTGMAVLPARAPNAVIDLTKEGPGAGIVFNFEDPGTYWLWIHQEDDNNVLYRYAEGIMVSAAGLGIAPTKSLRVSLADGSARLYRDGVFVAEVKAPVPAGAKHGLSITSNKAKVTLFEMQ
jgi:hypothetical protein